MEHCRNLGAGGVDTVECRGEGEIVDVDGNIGIAIDCHLESFFTSFDSKVPDDIDNDHELYVARCSSRYS